MTDELAGRMQRDRTGRVLVRLGVSPVTWLTIALTVLLMLVAGGLSVILVVSTGGSPGQVVDAMWTGSLANAAGWTNTLLNAAPLLLVAAGTCVAASAGAFNIGQEGQVLVGALAGAWVGLRLALPGPLLVVGVLLASAVGGGLWAMICALMYRYRNVNIPVSTLLMTFVAVQLVSFAVSTPWFLQESAQGSSGIADSVSNPVPSRGLLPTIGQYPSLQLNVGLFIAVVAALVIAVLLARSRWGFRLRQVGLSPLAAKHSGARVGALSAWALAISGAFAGVAGGVLLTSPIGSNRLQAGISDNIGWDGLLVALVARSRPMAAIPVALLFGVLRAGGDFLSATGVPTFLVDVVKSLLVLAFVTPPVLVDAIARRRLRAAAAGRSSALEPGGAAA